MARGDHVRIAAFVQGFAHGRGRATTSLEQVSALAERGHEVTVFLPGVRAYTRVSGVTVHPIAEFDRDQTWDVVVYNSGLPKPMRNAVGAIDAPRLMCQHSYNTSDAGLALASTVWYPSRACANTDTSTRYRKFHCAPPINADLYRVRPGSAVGAISTARAKGGDVVAALARRMTRRRFVVARDPAGEGAEMFAGMKNVELLPFGDPAQFYARCRILLFPSVSESYGRAPVEAAVSGIPTIATPLKAVREALGGKGEFIPRHQTGLWVREVERMMRHQNVWRSASLQAQIRGKSVDYQGTRSRWASEVERLAR